LIHAPKEKIYGQTIDFSNWPRLYSYTESANLVSEHENERVIECVIRDKKGKKKVRKLTQRIISESRIDEEQQTRIPNMLLNMIQTYQEVEGGTEYTINGCLHLLKVNDLHPVILMVFRGVWEKGLRLTLENLLEGKKKASESP
jgi:hypothetical protein